MLKASLFVCVLGVFAGACGGGGDCETIYESLSKCEGGKLPDKDKFIERCKKASEDPEGKEEIASALECSKADSCDAAKACQKAQRGKKRAKEVSTELAAGKVKDAFSTCTINEDYYADPAFKAACASVFAAADKLTAEEQRTAMYRCKSDEKIKKVSPEFAAACTKMGGAAVAEKTKTLTAARDAGKRDYKSCLELKDASANAGAEAVAAAEKLCAENDVAEEAAKAIAEAAKAPGEARPSMPYQCDTAPEKLVKLDTPWAKTQTEAVLKACYVDLGAVLIEKTDAKYTCPYALTKLKEGGAKYDVATKLPAFAELLTKLPAKCK